MKTLNDYITLQSRFRRSVNVSADQNNFDGLQGYIITENVKNTLKHISTSLESLVYTPCFSLIGQFGSGKSSFAVLLSHLLSSQSTFFTQADKLLSDSDKTLADQFSTIRGKKGFLSIVVTARRRPLAEVILFALRDSLSSLCDTELLDRCSKLCDQIDEGKSYSDLLIIKLFTDIIDSASKCGYSGVFLFIDEMGKIMEYAAYDNSATGDLYLLQQLAELSARQSNIPFLFILSLHQNIESYTSGLLDSTRREWNKISGRFEEIHFAEGTLSVMNLVAESLIRSKKRIPIEAKNIINNFVSSLSIQSLGLPPKFSLKAFTKMAEAAWPFHPSALLALPYLFKKLSQNERSLFAFLNSEENFGFKSLLSRTDDQFIRLEDLFDYFVGFYETGSHFDLGHSLRETAGILRSRTDLDQQYVCLLKMIGILGEIQNDSPLKASQEFLSHSFYASPDITRILSSLTKQSLITLRKLTDSYSVFTGSAVDLAWQYKLAEDKLKSAHYNSFALLQKYLPKTPKIARRHYLEKGIMRYFSIHYSDILDSSINLNKTPFAPSEAGRIQIIVSPHAFEEYEEILLTKNSQTPNKDYDELQRIIFVLVKPHEKLSLAVLELAKIDWIIDNVPELRNDKIAYREIRIRQTEWLDAIDSLVSEFLNPACHECKWFYKGNLYTPQSSLQTNKLISDVCDKIYHNSPILKNELLVKNNPSSQASAARRELLTAIVQNPYQYAFGINSYAPQRSLYESLINEVGLHIKNGDEYLLSDSDLLSHKNSLHEFWMFLTKKIYSKDAKQVSLLSLRDNAAAPPIGIPYGVFMLYFAIFQMLHSDEVFIYRDGTFIHEMSIDMWELLMKRPQHFMVSGVKLDGVKEKIVARVCQSIKAKNVSLKSVVSYLLNFYSSLPPITKSSTKFSNPHAKNVINAFENAKSPDTFLYIELPMAIGIESVDKIDDNVDEYVELFFSQLNAVLSELHNHMITLERKSINFLIEQCGVNNWEELKYRAKYLLDRHKCDSGIGVINCICSSSDGNVQPTLSALLSKPFIRWNDNDFEIMQKSAQTFGEGFTKDWQKYGFSILNKKEENTVNVVMEGLKSHLSNETINSKIVEAILQRIAQEYIHNPH